MSKQYEHSELQKDPPCSMPENNEENLASEASGNQKPEGVTRRKFVALAGTLLAVTTLGTSGIMAFARDNNIDVAFPVSGGYLIVDSMRCCGCQNCMMACAMTHHGVTNPGLARIQIVGDSFQHFPYDMTIFQCHQCAEPKCVSVCPTGACHIDEENDNVRVVDPDKCIGCMQCISACPNSPSRLQWNSEDKHSQKCDLCTNTPFWEHEVGPDGVRACELVCPERAIKFVKELPKETGGSQYDVDLRTGTSWPSMMTYAVGATGNPGSEGSSAKK